MKPKMSSVFSRLAPLVLLLTVPSLAEAAGDVAAHRTEQDVKDSLKAALPFLEDKVASTIKDGASTPVAFHGEAQLRSMFHRYTSLVDSSYLFLARQGFVLGGEEPILKVGMVVTPGRNTVMWAKFGMSASYAGHNQYSFLNPQQSGDNVGHSYVIQHHNANKKVGVFEDMSAGIAIRTKPASFMLKMGAMNWNEASPLSIWKAQPRMFAWEYLPYEIEQPIAEYYKYNIAKGEKVGRAAWNKKPFQGIDFSITDIPGDFTGYFLYGAGDPYDRFERNSMDMAVDLAYEGDEGSIAGTGIGDAYRKHVFYRLSKKFSPELQVGFNNGYIITSTDIVNAGFKYDFIFNSKFDVGLYNSLWQVGNEKVQLKDKASYQKILEAGVDTAITVGEGYILDPKYFSIDARGTIGKVSYMADVGLSMVDTTFISIDNSSYPTGDTTYKNLHVKEDGTFSSIEGSNTYVEPGKIYRDSTTDALKNTDLALFLSMEYKSKVDVGVEFLYAGKNFYSPYSFVMPHDGFYASGSNLLGAGKFLGSEASPYSKNMFGTGITVKPHFPWYGHMKVKYGFNRQLSEGRDILFFPYRLNGASMVASFNDYYNKWGLGRLTENYYFLNSQGGYDVKDSLAKHPTNRIGDESYGTLKSGRTIQSPTSGGMRADAHVVTEGFVPYSNPMDAIFNIYSMSSLVTQERDLSEIWDDNTRSFVDRRQDIKGVRVEDEKGVQYYSMLDDTLEIRNADSTVISKEVVKTKSSTGFVPVSMKNSFNLAFDWALDIGKYIGYRNDLFLSLYYEVNGASKGFVPFAVNAESDDVFMMSHYLRSEPAIALTKEFYLLGLIGWERWMSDKAWVGEYEGEGTAKRLVGLKKSKIETTDLALGLGFDWDMMKRVSLHGRYKWSSHKDETLPDVRYDMHAIFLELKAYF